MPRGARHVETGILRPGEWGCALETDGGGMWQLDVAGSARRYLGRRVTVEGTRSGFDLLDVHRICPGNRLAERSSGGWSDLLRRFGFR